MRTLKVSLSQRTRAGSSPVPGRHYPTVRAHLAEPLSYGKADWPDLYFILDDYGEGKGPIKVGVSSNPKARLYSIRSECIGKPVLLGVVDHGGRELESKLLAEFSEYRLRGEWLYPCEALLQRIRELCAGGGPVQ